MEELKPVAREALDAFESIAASAKEGLSSRGVTLDSFAMVNEATAEKLSAELRERNEDRIGNLQRLRYEPAIARLVIEDEDENLQTLYLSPAGTVPSAKVALCSYMSPKGMLAARDIGEEVEVPLPGGPRWFLLREKLTFKALEDGAGWDARPAVQFRESASPRSFKSLRDLLAEDGYSDAQIDALGAWLEEGDVVEGASNEYEGIKRDSLTAMQLRIAPILDRFQDGIFRLPIDRQIAVFGPPGTGKTTTMVRRLRQKLDVAYLDEDEKALVEGRDAAGLAHADSWILFTPTELLRLYVKEAASKEGVPAHDERLRTWEDYRWAIARNVLGILRRGSGGGFTMPLPADDSWLAEGTLLNQRVWFEAFEKWQADDFVQQLVVEAERLAKADDTRAVSVGNRVEAAISRSGGNVVRLLGELAGMRSELIQLARSLGEGTKGALAQPLRVLAAEDSGFLDALAATVTAILAEQSLEEEADDAEDDDAEDDIEADGEETRPTLQGRRLVADVFQRAMRTLALRQASGRRPSVTSRAGRILAFLEERGVALPDLKGVGRTLLLQRAAGRLPPRGRLVSRGISLLAFLYQSGLPPRALNRFLFDFALVPSRVFGQLRLIAPSDWTPFLTNIFLHAGWLHLILNMWTLWILGPAVEDRLGPVRFALFYLFCGLAAGLAHALANPDSVVPALGASGAIAGVIGCYARMFPAARLVVIVPILVIPLFFEISALAFAMIWFVMQLILGLMSLGDTATGGVAWWAHIGGFVSGWLASCLVATHHWDMVSSAIADHAWRFAAFADEVS